MKQKLIKTVFRSLLYHKKDSVLQVIIVALLAAIITGSLFTGHSVRMSLRKTVSEKLGKTDILISSGLRFFDSSLSGRITAITGLRSVSILETDGFCQNFSTGATALNTKIYGIRGDFFPFYGTDPVKIEPGTAAVNAKLANRLGIKPGNEIIIHFRETDPIPENAPFASAKDKSGSTVLKVSAILTPEMGGNFSLGANQIIPMNIFLNQADISGKSSGKPRTNRLLIQNSPEYDDSSFYSILARKLKPGDIGLSIRKSDKTGESEIISDRVFIDSATVNEIMRIIPAAYPLLTYLANSINHSGRSTPYSFIAALPVSLSGTLQDDEIAINKWLAGDLDASVNDSLEVKYFNPGRGRFLEERSRMFIIRQIIDNDSKYSDPSLMPEFPGISGSTTCAGWDAGVPVLLDRIREKDEDYWNRYRGTPKAFISYKTGKALWGSNFGPATAIRFPVSMDSSGIKLKLTGKMDPAQTGFTIADLRKSNISAADEGVNFSVLFLALSLFIIISCIVLLSMVLTLFFDSRKNQVTTFYALGFRNSRIRQLLFIEAALISVTGTFAGIFIGYVINVLIVKGLNSVWYGAVQMNTISPVFNFMPLLSGFLITLTVTFMLLYIKLGSFLRQRAGSKSEMFKPRSSWANILLMAASVAAAIIAVVLSVLPGKTAVALSFASGGFLFVSMVLALRYYYISGRGLIRNLGANYSKLFYSFHPSQAVAPSMFVAAGIFALMVTGANRQVLNRKMLLPSGGTGGYQLWAESALPVIADLNSANGRKEFGFDGPEFRDVRFVQARRVSGDDASCLNINHVTSPPLLGIDPSPLILKGSFSFATRLKKSGDINPWELLNQSSGKSTIYGIADQTVLEWSLKLKTGDTLKYRTENGQLLNIVICAGLRSSVFQGYLLIGEKNLERYFPSVPGSSVFLAEGNAELAESCKDVMNERLSGYGISIEPAGEKLASFFAVTNTYIEVFMVLGIMGLILGSAGFGLVLIRNFNARKREFAVMAAMGYSARRIRKFLLKDQLIILLWGIFTGVFSAATATLASIKSGAEMPLGQLITMISLILATGIIVLLVTVRQVHNQILVSQLRKE
jgi:putative ABC transport system permease protein